MYFYVFYFQYNNSVLECEADTLQRRDHLGGFRDVPDVYAQANDARILREHDLCNVERALVDVEFQQLGAIPQFTQVGEQIAQSEGSVDIFRVQRAENNVGHQTGG